MHVLISTCIPDVINKNQLITNLRIRGQLLLPYSGHLDNWTHLLKYFRLQILVCWIVNMDQTCE